MDIQARAQAFIELGNRIRGYVSTGIQEGNEGLEKAVYQSIQDNSWFDERSVRYMLNDLADSLSMEQIRAWTDSYTFQELEEPKKVAVVMAGNLPLVGFHDFLSVLMTGHAITAKLSADDKWLLPALADMLAAIQPGFRKRMFFTDDKIKDFDAVIATGSNNTSRYFKYYFSKYPHIIRKNRNGVGVITGAESHEQLKALGEDIFTYYGLGCRNVSKIFVPRDYDIKLLLDAIEDYAYAGDHHKYRNNYDYNKSIFLVNGDPHFDNGFLLLKEDAAIASPVSVLNFERFDSVSEVNESLSKDTDNIQCVVSVSDEIENAIPLGTSQHPKLWDYADGVDTLEFLLGLTGSSN